MQGLSHSEKWLYRRQLIFLAVIFIAHGALFTNFLIRIPTLKDNLDITEGTISWIIFSGGIGVLTAFTLSGNLINRIGSQRLMVISTFLVLLWLPVLGMMNSVFHYMLGFYILGLVNTIMDVAMNEYAVEFEQHYDTKIMSRMHGFFSLGTVITGLAGTLYQHYNTSLLFHFTSASIFWFVICLLATLYLYQNRFFPSTTANNFSARFQFGGKSDAIDHGPVFSLPPRSLIGLGIIAICGALIEGSVMDWSTLYISESLHVSEALSPLGLTCFALAMMCGRFAGDWLNTHFATDKLLRTLAIFSATGMTLALSTDYFLLVLTGFTMAGFGSALVYPIVFREAGKRPNVKKGHGVAGVASMGYMGFIFGPVVIGHLAEWVNLRNALLITIAAALLIILRSKELQHD